MGVTQNSYIPHAWEVSDLKVSGATPSRQVPPSSLRSEQGSLALRPSSHVIC